MTLGHLASMGANATWCAICQDCGHRARMAIGVLVACHGPQMPLGWVRQRLKCSQCGSRHVMAPVTLDGPRKAGAA